MRPKSKSLSLIILTMCIVSYSFCACSLAQTKPSDAETQQDPIGITFSEPIEQTWDFGMRVSSTGGGTGIMVLGPVPMNWPEQEIEIISEDKSGNVGKLKFKDIDKHAKQLSFGINRMGPGDKAHGIVKFKVKKKLIVAPKDPSLFLFAKKIPKNVKTYLKPSPFIESKNKRIKEIAKTIQDDSLTDWDQVEAIYTWVRENIEYKFDRVNHSCLYALDNKHGDCEELSALFIAICRAKGIPARAVWVPGHTYPEFYLQDKDGNGHWFPCQAAGTYEFGAMSETRPILQKGDRFRIARKEVRYLQPTLTVPNGNGLSLQWVTDHAKPSKN